MLNLNDDQLTGVKAYLLKPVPFNGELSVVIKVEAEMGYNKLSDVEKAKYESVEDYYYKIKDSYYYVAVNEQLKTKRK